MGISVFDEETIRHAIHDEKDIEKQKAACKEIFDEQIECAKQRVERGFSDHDLWDISNWFLTLIPEMLKEYKDKRHGSPGCLGKDHVNDKGILVNDTCHQEWDKILDEMIFLFRECREDTCSQQNEFAEEHMDASNAFTKQYGLFGEKLETPEEKERNKKTNSHTLHFMSELTEYKEIDEKYMQREQELDKYREDCRLKAMALFTKWMPYLWD